MITYTTKPTVVEVRVEGRLFGHIKQVPGGYQYFPLGQKTGGGVFKTLTEVKSCLEGE